MDTSSPVLQTSQKASKFVLWLFAGVGFIAAIIQIAQYVWPNASELKVSASIQQPLNQRTVVDALNSNTEAPGFLRSLVDNDRKDYCELASSPKVPKDDADLASSKCRSAKAALGVLDLVLMNPDFRIVSYDLENTGSQIARELRVSAKDVTEVILTSGTETRDVARKAGEDFFRLPDLNPGEKLAVAVWSTSYAVDPKNEYMSESDLPKITFSGGKPDLTMLRLIPSFYTDVKYFLDIFPLPISMLLIIALCFLVTMLVVAFFTAIDALIRGKPLNEAFGTAGKAKPTDVSD